MMTPHSASGAAKWFCLALMAGGLWVGTARADIFHMKWGATIEGVLLDEGDEAYRVKTPIGVVDLDKEDVVKIEKATSPWEEYRQREKDTAKTAEAHYQLALWCEERGLPSKRVKHLKIAIELDPNHAAARGALGYEKKGDAWVRKSAADAPTDEDLKKRRKEQQEERLIRETIANWFVKLRAIHGGRMEKKPSNSRQFKDARDFILNIDDALAVPAITGVLSTGRTAVRRVMVESLAQFDNDEATMNLLVIAVLDPSSEIRRGAAVVLHERKDDRIVEQLCEALKSEEEFLLRNAASALGVMRARSAVPDLVAALSTEKLGYVPVSRPVFLGGVYSRFGCRYLVRCGSRRVHYWPRRIGCICSGSYIGTQTEYETQIVSIYRTEVQEALIAITGENHGFDGDRWLDWWRFNKSDEG